MYTCICMCVGMMYEVVVRGWASYIIYMCVRVDVHVSVKEIAGAILVK